MFIAMNRFKVNKGKQSDFEDVWRNRDSQLQQVPGFVAFSLLRNWLVDDTTEYISHSTWESREAFEAWRESESFNRGHGGPSLQGVLAGPPEVALYEAVLHETRETAEV